MPPGPPGRGAPLNERSTFNIVKMFIVLPILAGIALAIATWQFLARNRQGAAVAAGLGAVGVVAAFWLKGESWNMSPIPIYSYGVMLGLSLVVGWYLTLGLADRDGLPKETMANCYVATALAAVAGSRRSPGATATSRST